MVSVFWRLCGVFVCCGIFWWLGVLCVGFGWGVVNVYAMFRSLSEWERADIKLSQLWCSSCVGDY